MLCIVQSGEKTYTLSKFSQFRTMEFFMRRRDFRRFVRTAFFVPNEKIVNRALKLCHAHAHAIAGDGKERSYRNCAKSAQVPGPDWIRLRREAVGALYATVRLYLLWDSIAVNAHHGCGIP
jgi:hypothetical protein